MKQLSWDGFVAYFARGETLTEHELKQFLKSLIRMKKDYSPTGFFIAECKMLDTSPGSPMGDRTCLAYGPKNTFKEIPTKPFSPKGLASDMAVAEVYIPVEDVPNALE